ncbi:MAG TPA: endonuclease III [Candidatus Polarisedimenticolia bacterium]|nr:endonuclease III [Candidatus Polarisedimenticolia bacterium]
MGRESAGRHLALLAKAFGRPRPGRRYAPLDELILTVLSQHTSDVNRDRAYAALRGRFPAWEDVLRARRADVERAIRAGGLARTKSRVIQDILRRVRQDQGRLDLGVLRTMPLADARAYLLGLRGVGEKTACCVLLFACGRPAFPVDTHIHRIARRVGWVPPKATPRRTHAILAGLIPKARYLEAHLNLISLGRRICRARAPRCPACPLRRLCRYAGRLDGPGRRPGLY